MAFWNHCLNQFALELPEQQFNAWIKPLKLQENSDQTLNLIAPNPFIRKWVKDKYCQKLHEMASDFFGKQVTLEFLVEKKPTTSSPSAGETPPVVHAKAAPTQPEKKEKTVASPSKTSLNPAYNFENLVTGKANNMAQVASLQVAENPGRAYNPLYIYGGSGLGKTHLMHAIGNYIHQNDPSKIVRYVHVEDYYTDVIQSYRKNTLDNLRRYYRSLDVLLVDDIQFLKGKEASQEQFFFLFNTLIENKKQVIVSCDTYPNHISGLQERIVTRLGNGLCVLVDPPEIEMRVAILKKKAEMAGIFLSEDVSFFIAKNLKSNVRELEGALNKVIAVANFHKSSIDLTLAKDALKDTIGSGNTNITLDGIIKTVCEYYKVKQSDIFSKSRSRNIVRPRQIAMWLARELTTNSYPAIGQTFGNRDHTTVINAVKSINDLKSKDANMNHDLHLLVQTIRGE